MTRPFRLVLGCALAIYGLVQLLWGWYYARISPREVTAIGTIQRIYDGRGGPDYVYSFHVGNDSIQDDDYGCDTAFTYPVRIGTHVLVYYDHTDPSTSKLHEYGSESRRSLAEARWMIPLGFVLLLSLYVQSRLNGKSKSEDETDDDPIDPDSQPLRVVPTEEA